MDIKSKIKYYMKAKKLNVYKLSQKSGLTQPTIANWFNSRNYTPSVEALEKVCSAFEISMAQLFCDDNENMIPASPEVHKLLDIWQILNKTQRDNFIDLLESIVTQEETECLIIAAR